MNFFICFGRLINNNTAYYLMKNKIIIGDEFFLEQNNQNNYIDKSKLIKYLFKVNNSINLKIIDMIRYNINNICNTENNIYNDIHIVDICKSTISNSNNYL